MFSSTDRYLAKLIAIPLFSTLFLSALLQLLDKMRRLFSFIEEEGGPINVVWQMLANLIPEYLGLGIPIGLALGVLLAFRKLALSSELDVLLATGQGYNRLMRVPFLFAIGLTIASFFMVGYIQPHTRYAYEGLRYDLRTGAFGAAIKIGEFTHFGKNVTLRIESSQNNGQDLSGIFVQTTRPNGQSVEVTAERGRFLGTDDKDVIILRLSHGVLVHNEPGFKAPRILSFDSHDLPFDLPPTERFRDRGSTKNEKTLPELWEKGHDLNTPLADRRVMLANLGFRIAEIAVMFLMPLLGVALAVPPKRSSSGIGMYLSVIMIVMFYKLNEAAETMSAHGSVPAIIGISVPFVLFAVLVIRMYIVLAYHPGGQPIAAVERLSTKIFKPIRALFDMATRRTTGAA